MIVITSIARTPLGNFLGGLKDTSATELGATVIKAAMQRSHLSPNNIDEVIMGCVLPAGLGQAPARQAALQAGLESSTPCTTVSKVCGSGMKAIMIACDMVTLTPTQIIIAGGMENMSQAPYLLAKARSGYRLGHNEIYDHMMLDGLEDAYDKGRPMGYFAEQTVTKYNFTREQQDQFSIESFTRAKRATQENKFQAEIVPVETKLGVIAQDEHPFSVNPEKIPQLKPVFVKEGTITAGSSSCISDGAAAVCIMSKENAEKHNLTPLATVKGYCSAAKNPHEFPTAPILAINKLLKLVNWTIAEVDLFEINEAFAVVTMAALKELNIPAAKLNIHGGAIALGHPIGASGARIIVTLIAALQATNLKRGIAALCIGGGEATAIAIELC